MKASNGSTRRLGVGFIGSGFNARFHMLGWKGVRDGDVLGVWSPNKKNAVSAAEYARSLDVGSAKAYTSITDMVADPAIDAIWLTGPNHARIENVARGGVRVTTSAIRPTDQRAQFSPRCPRRSGASRGTNFHAVVHAQPPYITYLSHIAAYRDEERLNRHLLHWEPETIVNLPEGIGVVPFLVPGSSAIVSATVKDFTTIGL